MEQIDAKALVVLLTEIRSDLQIIKQKLAEGEQVHKPVSKLSEQAHKELMGKSPLPSKKPEGMYV